MRKPLFLFAPGAGASSTSMWMTDWAARLEAFGRVVRFDYPYMVEGKRRPDPQPLLINAHRKALTTARAQHPGPVVLIGKSMGSRMGCHVSLEEKVNALVCLGYPLRGQNGKLRDEVLLALRTPVLFIQGTRDALCPLDELQTVRAKMKIVNDIYVVEEGDHSLDVTKTWLKKNGATQESVNARILGAIDQFLQRHAPARD